MDEADTLIIVESPTKAKTISKFLPANCKVVASKGHIRDLPEDRMAIDVEHDFACDYEVVAGKESLIKELKSNMKKAGRLLLATDEDREGESISWHLIEVLKPKIPYKRMVFHEITKSAILKALDGGRPLDENLVHAQEGRRIIDRLYGYTLSPILWRKLSNKKLSAGRVQSVGLRLTVQRERERLLFSQNTYYDAKADLLSKQKQRFEAKLTSYQDKRIAGSKDFDSVTGAYKAKGDVLLLNKEQAAAIVNELADQMFVVTDIQRKPFITRPNVPFTTSTLQQDAIKKLHISASDTMRIAQKLYESGFITYMRTDSPALSEEGTQAARLAVQNMYGHDYLSPSARHFAAKSLGAQEAHEAIRPAGDRFLAPSETHLSGKDLALYELIWKRTLASQMADAQKATTTVTLKAGKAIFGASGTEIVFPGFLRAYVEGSDDPEAALEDSQTLLPVLAVGDSCPVESLVAVEHQTKSPARYTEASLVQELEKRGIGRPSTYATIIKTLLDRKYVVKEGSALAPTFVGFAVCQFLETNYPKYIDYDFTSMMEDGLDKIAGGELDKRSFLQSFYFGDGGLNNLNTLQLGTDNKVASKTLRLPHISDENPVMIGPYGPYITAKDGSFVSLPPTWLPGNISDEDVKALATEGKAKLQPLNLDADASIKVMNGRFGPYWQEGDGKDAKRQSIPKWVQDANRMDDVELARRYLMLPRVLGNDSEGNEVLACKGKYGPYITCNGKTRNLRKNDNDQELFSITLDQALDLLSKEDPKFPAKGRKDSPRVKASTIKELGEFEGEKVSVANGRYGYYLKVGKENIGLPDEYKRNEQKALSLNLEEAIGHIRTKRAKE